MHSLTPSQGLGADLFTAFLGTDRQVFILRGSAGTGKTTLVSTLITRLVQANRPFATLAPTGRAARILGAKTKSAASTVHRQIYSLGDVEVFEDAESSNDSGLRLIFPLKQDDPGETVFVIDEASLVGDRESKGDVLQFGSGRLLADLIHYARLGRPGRSAGQGARIVFIGDPAQLPPVGEGLSPALSAPYLKETFGLDCEEFELKEIMRQASGSAVLECATSLRDAIGKREFTSFSIPPANDQIFAVTIPEAVSHVVDAYRSTSSSVLITHTNAQALEFNRAVRGRLWNDDKAALRTDDLLLVNKNSPTTGLLNGDLVKIVEVAPSAEVRRVPIKGVEHPVELMFRKVVLAYREANGHTARVESLVLENLLDSPERELTPVEQRALLVDFRQRNPKLKTRTAEFRMAIRHDPWFNALQVKFGYALTCHKAQGGEWETAVVSFSSTRGEDNEDFFRWAYTAITRAKNQLLTINAPKFNATTGIRWGAVTPAPTVIGNESAAQVVASDDDWQRLSFSPGKEGLFKYHLALRNVWASVGIAIDRLDHLQYCERYHLSQGDKVATVQYQYKGSLKVSTIGAAPGTQGDLVMVEECVSLMREVLVSTANESTATLDPFLEDFRNKVEAALAGTGVRLVGAEALQYLLRLSFAGEGHEARIDFYYDGKKRWTRATEVGGVGSSRGIYELVQKAIGTAP